jgi:hypothetical protein
MPKGKSVKTAHEEAFGKSMRTMNKIVRLAKDLTVDDRDYLCARLQQMNEPMQAPTEQVPKVEFGFQP